MDANHVEGAWALRLYTKPFIRWIWGGGLFMMLGGFVSAADRRFRVKREAEAAQTDPDAACGNRKREPAATLLRFCAVGGAARLWHLVEQLARSHRGTIAVDQQARAGLCAAQAG